MFSRLETFIYHGLMFNLIILAFLAFSITLGLMVNIIISFLKKRNIPVLSRVARTLAYILK